MIQHILLLLLVFCFLLSCGSEDDEATEETTEALENAVIQEILDSHNSYRSDVTIADLIWSESVATSAQAWADKLASDCDFKHSQDEYGENIWKGTSGAFSPTDVVNSWGSEIANYDYDSNSCADDEVCGHYTQIVWKNTTNVGCGMATCDGQDIWVCQYNPAGNIKGQKPY